MTTKPQTAAGCWGSAVFHRTASLECAACAHNTSCALSALALEHPVTTKILQLDQLFATDKRPVVFRWFKKRWEKESVDTIAKRAAKSRAEKTRKAWSANGLNPFELSHGKNPAPKNAKALHSIFAFMLKVGPFTTRDVVEHLREERPSMNKVKTQAYVKDVCGALVSENILKKEGRNVLCL